MLRMDIRTFTHNKNFFLLFILLLTISCSTVTVENTYSKGNSPIQKSQNIEGKFKLSYLDSKETGYFIINKTLNTVSLTLGKNFLLPEEVLVFDARESISINEFVDFEIEPSRDVSFSIEDFLGLFSGIKSRNFQKKGISINFEFDSSINEPSKVELRGSEFELYVIVRKNERN